MAHPVLWQFRYSHFNEKARWALDYKRFPHVRRSLLPGLHIPRVLWLTRQKALPVLMLEGNTIADSTRIIEALERVQPDPPLYPADPAARRQATLLEDFFDEELGPHLRRALFYELLPFTDYAAALIATGTSATTRRLYRAAFPLIRQVMRLDMGINAESAAVSRAKVDAAFDRVERELQPSGYLVGDRFSVADLTAAALLSPLVIPPEFPYALPGPLPKPLATYRESVSGRRGYQWVLEMYRRHRGTSSELA
jgi:glutathione S-transferase